MNLKKSVFLILGVLFFDQFVKILVKTHMMLGEQINVLGNWFIIHFTENNGMAFGMELGGNYGKISLSLFRIVALCGIGWYLNRLHKEKANWKMTVPIALIFAGAFGNIIDSMFYGLIFDNSFCQIATLFPDGGGYGTFLHGRVVDMLYFPLIEGHFPTWFPFWGGEEFIFFRPVFNISDSSITVGIVLLLLFQSKFFNKKQEEIIG
ncbi:MAG: lipoprotein signal peptidase [Bacteroidota bacterium]|nr:lipoprotein signal peptidase [Bacteroidota bacterium]